METAASNARPMLKISTSQDSGLPFAHEHESQKRLRHGRLEKQIRHDREGQNPGRIDGASRCRTGVIAIATRQETAHFVRLPASIWIG